MQKQCFHVAIRSMSWLIATVVLTTFTQPIELLGQEHKNEHHHYELIDVGTFGGPSSYFDDLSLSDRFGFSLPVFTFAPVLNKQGILAGWADTPTPDPYSPFCFNPDCFVSHAFLWQNGIKTDLGALPGGDSSATLWINSKGWTVGYSQNGNFDPVIPGFPEIRAVLWKEGRILNMGTLGGTESYAGAVNNHGQVVGTSLNDIPDSFSFFDLLFFPPPGFSNGSQTRAFIWDEEHGMQDLGTLGGPDAAAFLVNDRGQVAGMSYLSSTPVPSTGIPAFHPFLWDKRTGMKDLGSLGGTQLGSVNGLNEQGQVVGATTIAGDQQLHAFLWDGEQLIDLTQPPFGGDANGEADWINEAGAVVGLAPVPAYCPADSQVGPIQHAFLWRKGQIADLGTLSGTFNSEGDFINSRSQVVGLSWTCDYVFTAFLWENGSMADLNTLIPPNSPFQIFAASFISDHGEIAAFGSLANGDQHALLLIPCDDDHPNIEGCDYSWVETVPPTQVPASESMTPADQKLTPSQMQNRVRTLISRNRRFLGKLSK